TAPETQLGAQVKAGSKNARTRVLGITSSYLDVRNYSLHSGRGVSPADVLNRSEVAVLGSRVAQTLFGVMDPVGAEVRINGRLFTVVGVLESRGGSALGIEDDQVLVPITTAHYRLSTRRTAQGDVNVQSINVQAVNAASMEDAAAQIGTVLWLRHRLGADDEDDFTVTSQQETIETLEETTQTFVIFLGAIAGISLLVGGIGIMNIMLVSVTERTGEIGIRRALGAKQRDITLQFVTEATLLSIGGGLIGVATGAGIALAIDGRTLGGQTFYTVLTTDTAVLALLVSAAIGLFFGIYPALRAARLNPIDALRSA
ncbi:MAG: ABC transporter permease, partial [Chloroflexi bacterium]|nr:ABC transporter permease [Chloroflexota bacterium]